MRYLGPKTFGRIITIRKTRAQPSDICAAFGDYLLWYAKNSLQ